jgi:flagellar hook-associated protein 1 FlgK
VSDFSSLQTALSALMTHRRAIEVTANNVANANTTGYTRRRVDLEPTGGAVPAIFSKSTSDGNGVQINAVLRISDAFLDTKVRTETASAESDSTVAAALQGVEQIFPEPGTDGMAAQLGELWASWNDLVANPGSTAARAAVLQQASVVVDRFHEAATQLGQNRQQLVDQVGAVASKVNEYADRIAQLNDAIQSANVGGSSTADLEDQRGVLLDELSKYAAIDVRSSQSGKVDVTLDGTPLVSGVSAQHLAVTQVADPALTPLGLQRVQMVWEVDGRPTSISGGQLAGNLTAANQSLPDAMNGLDAVAANLVSAVNTLHLAGKDLGGTTGRAFFDPTGTRASTLALSTDVAGLPANLAAASATGGALDTTVGQQIAALGLAPNGPDATYRSFVAQLGTQVAAANRGSDVQASIRDRTTSDRAAVTGVSIDEEMVGLVASQHAYSAAARVMTSVDEMLDTLINHTGIVGR